MKQIQQKQYSTTQCRVGAEGVRFGEGFGDFFYFRAQNGQIWCVLGAVFYSSTACFRRNITELMVLKGKRPPGSLIAGFAPDKFVLLLLLLLLDLTSLNQTIWHATSIASIRDYILCIYLKVWKKEIFRPLALTPVRRVRFTSVGLGANPRGTRV